jgi:hypothetical protein
MSDTSITAKAPAKDDFAGGEATMNFNFGETVDEAVELFGADVVLNGFIRANVVTLQGAMRAKLRAGVEGEDVSDSLLNPVEGTAWKPGVQRVATGEAATKKFEANFDKMSDEDQQAYIAKLQARAEGN